MSEYKVFHRYMLVIDKNLWQDFLKIKPANKSANEFIVEILAREIEKKGGK